jgi:bifunctional DNase/RNase
MQKIQVDILGLSNSQAGTNAYALILKETDGVRQLPIVIGAPEAQAIANELEGVRPQRPMTHDLLKNIIDALGASVREVVISNLQDGTFFANIIFEYSEIEIDARPSDAIALSVRCGVPIYVVESVLDEAGFRADEDEQDAEDVDESSASSEGVTARPDERTSKAAKSPRQQLEDELAAAIDAEDYERAAQLRDELSKL